MKNTFGVGATGKGWVVLINGTKSWMGMGPSGHLYGPCDESKCVHAVMADVEEADRAIYFDEQDLLREEFYSQVDAIEKKISNDKRVKMLGIPLPNGKTSYVIKTDNRIIENYRKNTPAEAEVFFNRVIAELPPEEPDSGSILGMR